MTCDLAGDVEVGFIDRDSFWLDFESMHVSKQVTAGAASQAAHQGLSVIAAQRRLAHLAAGAPTPLSVLDCTRLGCIAVAAQRYAPLAPAHAPFVRARDAAAPSATWLLPVRAGASVAASLAAVPARAALPAFTKLARSLMTLPFAPAGWRRPRPSVAPLALVADTLPARCAGAGAVAGDVVDYRDIDVEACERFDAALVAITCPIVPGAVATAAQVAAPAAVVPASAPGGQGLTDAQALSSDAPVICTTGIDASEPAVDFDPSDPEIAALLRELDALESAPDGRSGEPLPVMPATFPTQAVLPTHHATVPEPPVAASAAPLMLDPTPVAVERAAPPGIAAGAADTPATAVSALEAPTAAASIVLADPAVLLPATPAPTAAASTATPPADAPPADAAQADAAPADAPQPTLRTSKRSRRSVKKQASPARPIPQPTIVATEPPAPVPSRYAPWEVPQPSPTGAGDVSQSITRSAFIDTPMPTVVVAPPVEPAPSPATSAVPAAPLFETPAFKTGEHVVLAPAAPIFEDEPSEEEAAHSARVLRFPSPFHARKINWKRTLAASLLLMLLEGAGFAAVYWFTKPSDVGYLMVRSSVEGLDVLIDGKLRGQTPLAVELPAGRHTIEMKGFGLSKVLPVEIASSVQTTQMVKWPRGQKVGTLQVSSAPEGARVIIDGEMRGVTPVTIESLVEGGHTLVLESDAGRVRQGVRVVANESTEVSVGIFAGWLNVFAPVQVRIFEDGKLLGTSEDGKLLLPPGEHHLELINQRLGLRERRTVEVTPGNTTTLSLDAPDGSIVVDAPEGTEVWIDGRARGVTPMAPLNTAVGTRDVVLRHPHIGQRRLAVQVGVKSPARAEFFTP